MITVAELIAEPQLGLSLLAGSEGLGNRITWAHTSDLPRLWEWVTGGEIMMTNGLSIPPDAAGQVELAESLVRAGASALAVGEKMHAPQLTPGFIDACNALPLPVVNVPYPLPFIAIARSVAESSLLEESRRLRQTARIYDLLRLAGAGNQWQTLLDGVAAEIDSQLFVVDRRCLHPWHPDSEALPAALAAELKQRVGPASAATKNFQWHRFGDQHILMMDIPTHANALLVVLPATYPHPDAVVLLHAATVLGLELSRTVLGLENRLRLGAEFLLQAFDGRYGIKDLESRLSEFEIPAQEFQVISLSSDAGQDLANVHAGLWRHGFPTVCLQSHNRLHILVSKECSDELLFHALPEGVRIGVSTLTTPSGIQRALQESLWALGTAGGGTEHFVRYAEGPSWLGLTSHEEGKALVQRLLGPVFEYERGRQPDLIVTLRTFLDMQRSWQKTATALFAHRQTIIYRIRKISELIGLDVTETATMAQLWFALQIHEAMEVGNSGLLDTRPQA
ncbi:PucR family transcriptional regulator ligand-binding domain-containing protein [Pseudarthrobacter sp. RMG13]|uniref:PucR family transcriptional regulator ligand-binding domain-containing protein n=1 Tax=Pseudarthrobacter humi TaxID=2952523 RepID=A0ABT1LTS3_9MICC|nr:PucR family transcriptional regulator [Pseudarthrobacter humi]MCP9000551.1 PucR family transcriptional regulator ligand-binding domain-containing protein [Pseudarthrobacter humi]